MREGAKKEKLGEGSGGRGSRGGFISLGAGRER